MQAVISTRSCQRDGVFDTRFLTQTEQPLPHLHHVNSAATGSGNALSYIHRMGYHSRGVLFEQIKRGDILFAETSDVLFTPDTIP